MSEESPGLVEGSLGKFKLPHFIIGQGQSVIRNDGVGRVHLPPRGQTRLFERFTAVSRCLLTRRAWL